MIINILCWLIVGALIGWLAGKFMKSSYGLIANIIIGIVGSCLGGWLAGVLGLGATNTFSIIGILIGVAGACILIFLLRLISGKR